MSESEPKKRKGKKPGPKPGCKYRHGGYSLLTRGALPQRRRYLAPWLTAIREGLIHDLARNEEELSTAQRILVDRLVTFLGVVRLIEEHAGQYGVLDPKGRPASGLTSHYLTFNRQIKEMLALLGVKRQAVERELTPAEIARIVDEEAAGQPEEGDGEKTQPEVAGAVPGADPGDSSDDAGQGEGEKR